ncbi:hypothetical protein [Roseovarius sp. Pro17]|uniref:hypothetical protein n=1 Tax=Roseovarius sp. Pro17 TaxID=3108175 RepID=UPI002D7775BB|nr:hypothetical protein [Roseovarius sp. Pro17]
MARERKTYTQKEGAGQDGARPNAHASELCGLASQPDSPHPALIALVKLLARQAAREADLTQDCDTLRKTD